MAEKYVVPDGMDRVFYVDAAKTVYASGCTALTELKADAAKNVYASGCNPNLKIKAAKGSNIYR